jgi:hypothetical protein
MRYGLRTLLFGAMILPPLLAAAWFVSRSVIYTIQNSTISDWQPLFVEVAALAGVIAAVTVTAALCHRSGSA